METDNVIFIDLDLWNSLLQEDLDKRLARPLRCEDVVVFYRADKPSEFLYQPDCSGNVFARLSDGEEQALDAQLRKGGFMLCDVRRLTRKGRGTIRCFVRENKGNVRVYPYNLFAEKLITVA